MVPDSKHFDMDYALELIDLNVGYGNKKSRRVILSDIRLSAASGQLIALVGPNGKGKSTLLKTIGGFLKPLEGMVRIHGSNLSQLTNHQRAKLISFVGTSHEINKLLRVRDLVALGRWQHSSFLGRLYENDQRIVYKAMLDTKILHLRDARIGEISDGELQRVLIARCLAQDTPIILLDEPTAFLDIANKFEMVDLMRRLVRLNRKTIIFSSHDLPTVIGNADLMWFIYNRSILEAIPEELVMTGFLDTFFEHSNVVFDLVKNEFRLNQKPDRFVKILGDETLVFWTEKALLRFGIARDNRVSEPEIHVKVENENILWMVNSLDKSYRFETLRDLLPFIDRQFRNKENS